MSTVKEKVLLVNSLSGTGIGKGSFNHIRFLGRSPTYFHLAHEPFAERQKRCRGVIGAPIRHAGTGFNLALQFCDPFRNRIKKPAELRFQFLLPHFAEL